MPESATITAFYSFTASTKARATQVNNNFDVFRGHLLPIDPNTGTAAATNTYDLGSTEYLWKNLYLGTAIQLGSTSTNSAVLTKDANTTASELVTKINNVELERKTNGNYTVNLATTTGQFSFKVGGTERFRISSDGFTGKSYLGAVTATAAVGGVARIATASINILTTTGLSFYSIPLVLGGSAKRPIFISSGGNARLAIQSGSTVGALVCEGTIYVSRSQTTSGAFLASPFKFSFSTTPSATVPQSYEITLPINLATLDTSFSLSTSTYYVGGNVTSKTAITSAFLYDVDLLAVEI